MRFILFFFCIIAVLSFPLDSSAFFLGNAQAAPEKDFNIVLITIDTLRADHLSCYGYNRETSPNIDRIAEEGILFKNVIAPSSWTAPSMVSLFTSTYPVNHGVVYGLLWKKHKKYTQDVLSEGLSTLPEILKTQGYTTFGVSSNHNLTAELGFARGIDYFKYVGNANSADRINEIVCSWEDKIKGGKKFFLWVHYMDPHHPYHDRLPWSAQYTSPSLTRALNLTGKSTKQLNKLIPIFKKNPEHLSNLIALYDSEINYVDSHVGQLIQKFELDKNTLIIITSDHGEEFLEHGFIGHAWNLYQETILVPLIIKLPYSSDKRSIDKSINLLERLPKSLWNATTLPIIIKAYFLKKDYKRVVTLFDQGNIKKSYYTIYILANSLIKEKRFRDALRHTPCRSSLPSHVIPALHFVLSPSNREGSPSCRHGSSNDNHSDQDLVCPTDHIRCGPAQCYDTLVKDH